MRFVVLGAGAIGGVVGARLAQHGQDVLLVARGTHGQAIADHGLTLRTPKEKITVQVPVVSAAGQVAWRPDDVVLLAVKSQDTVTALGQLADAAPLRTPVVCLQNGVENERAALRVFPRVYAVPVLAPTGHLTPGVVESYTTRTTGILDIGRYPSGVDELAREISAVFAASGFVSLARPDIMRWKWAKLLLNLGNALEALVGPGAVPEGLLRAVREEGLACLRAAGLDVASAEEDRARRGDLLDVQSLDDGPRPGGSTWQSLVRRTGTIETDYLTGEVVLLGRLHGVPTPVNAVLATLARQASAERRPPGSVPVEDLVALLPAQVRAGLDR